MLALSLLLSAAAAAQIGQFESSQNIGDPRNEGTVHFNREAGEYRVTGGGANVWGARDEFYFVSKKIRGDFRLTADVRFPEPGGDPHRKAGWMVRKSPDPGSPYIDAVVHGDGLTSLQYREAKGGETKEAKAEIAGPLTLRLERRGKLFTMWAAKPGEPLQVAASATVALKDPVLIGLAVCSHNADALETAVFSNVRIEKAP
ncbi:MAG TPA: hypothetical protein VN428_09665 [Bryobacteraceae bacterium]|nr:hypothetical protein [Bryobacteraceae bacterium]